MTIHVRTGLPNAVRRQLRYPDFFETVGPMRWFDRRDKVAAVLSSGGVKAAWTAPGGIVGSSTVATESVPVSRDQLGFHVCEPSTLTEADLPDQDHRGAGKLGRGEANVGGGSGASNAGAGAVNVAGVHIEMGVNIAAATTEDQAEAERLCEKVAGPAAQALDFEMLQRLIASLTALGQDGAEPESQADMLERGAQPLVLKWAGQRTRSYWADATVVPFDLLVDRARLTDEQREAMPVETQFAIGSGSVGCVQFGRLLTKEYVEGDGWYYHLVARVDVGLVVALGSTILGFERR